MAENAPDTEQARADEIWKELHRRETDTRFLADRLPEAIALSGSSGGALGRALSPTIETALRESIRRHPREVTAAIFPVLGPAIRKSIAEATAQLARSINRAVQESFSLTGLKWRIEAWRSGIPYPQIVVKHALVYRVEQVFLIHAETGLLLAHVAAPELVVQEAELVSSMLTAIQDFVRDSFRPGEGATLRTFSVGDQTVQVEAGPRALLAVVIKGNAPRELLLKLQDTLETVHLEFATQLADFSGDSAPFERALPLLESCLETVVSTDQGAEKRKAAWLKVAIPLALGILLVAGSFIRSSMRWNRGLAALRAEPGIVVVDAFHSWGRKWHISGLKDPLARSPRAVIAEAGVGNPSVAGEWEGYLSLDPEMIRARTTRSIDSLRRDLEGGRILFAAGSAGLDPAAIARLSSAAGTARRLDELAATVGRTVRIGLTGRTDMSGADGNATLAEKRVSAVSDALASMGIARSRLISDPVAADKPLTAPDPVERERINRSVSFNVAMSRAPSSPGGER